MANKTNKYVEACIPPERVRLICSQMVAERWDEWLAVQIENVAIEKFEASSPQDKDNLSEARILLTMADLVLSIISQNAEEVS